MGTILVVVDEQAIRVTILDDEKEQLKAENRRYQERMEYLVKKRLQAEALQISHLASLGELAPGIAHEINNPVNGIISCADILKDECKDQERDDEIACRIIKEGERIATIVGNRLYFARDIEEEYTPVHLGTILEAALSLIGKQISKDGIKEFTRVIADLPMATGPGSTSGGVL